jgi:putative DNA primase/helicase
MILDLAEQLEAESSGILAWQIEGLKEWQKIGLAPPKAVTDASTEYLDSADKIQNWIDDKCEIGAGYSAGSTELYESFRQWSNYPKDGMSQTAFVRELVARKCQTRKAAVRMIDGLRLLTANKPADGNSNPFHSTNSSSEKPGNGLFH